MTEQPSPEQAVRPATDDELLAMVLYTGLHHDRLMADEAARRVSILWGRPVHVVLSPTLALWALYDSVPDASPEIQR